MDELLNTTLRSAMLYCAPRKNTNGKKYNHQRRNIAILNVSKKTIAHFSELQASGNFKQKTSGKMQ